MRDRPAVSARGRRNRRTPRHLARPLRDRRPATYRLLVLPPSPLAVRSAAQQPRRRPALPAPLREIRHPDRLQRPLIAASHFIDPVTARRQRTSRLALRDGGGLTFG